MSLSKVFKKRLASLVCSLMVMTALIHVLKPSQVLKITHPQDLTKVSAFVHDQKFNASAVLLRSSKEGTEFLTNAHVCESFETSAPVLVRFVKGQPLLVTDFKMSKNSDLCLFRVKENLHRSIVVASEPARIGDPLLTGGYPLGLPLVIQKGYASRIMNHPNQSTMLVSMLVQHGASGSGIFNEDGELTALICIVHDDSIRSNESIGFGGAVLLSDIKRFLEVESKQLEWTEIPNARP